MRDRPQRRVEGVVGRRDHVLVALRAHFTPAPHDAPRKGEDHPWQVRHRLDGGLGGGERRVGVRGEDQEVAAAHSLLHTERLFDEELPFHDRQPPVALAGDQLARLKAVTEHAQRLAHRQPVRRVRQAVETGGGGTREHGLPHPHDQLLGKARLVHREKQHADTGSSVRRLALLQLALDPRFALAADDRRGEAGELHGRFARPFRIPPRDDESGDPHRERLGERVLDRHAVDLHGAGSTP